MGGIAHEFPDFCSVADIKRKGDSRDLSFWRHNISGTACFYV